jgi:hypothetical protein
MVSRLRHNSTSSPRSGSPVARLPQRITGRHKDSPKVGNKKHKNQHPSRGRNNFGAITPAASEREVPEPLLFRRKIVGRFCETPTIGFNLK